MNTLVRVERHQISSKVTVVGGIAINPGIWDLTWLRTPHMPWVLIKMEPAP